MGTPLAFTARYLGGSSEGDRCPWKRWNRLASDVSGDIDHGVEIVLDVSGVNDRCGRAPCASPSAVAVVAARRSRGCCVCWQLLAPGGMNILPRSSSGAVHVLPGGSDGPPFSAALDHVPVVCGNRPAFVIMCR